MDTRLFLAVLKYFLIPIFFCVLHPAWAQWPQWSVAPQFGFVAAHREEMKHLQQGHAVAGVIGAWRRVDGRKAWHLHYALPKQGIEAGFISTGNPTQLGQQVVVNYAVDLPLNKWRKKSLTDPHKGYVHSLVVGLGTGYATKIWDLRTNHQANVLGSRFNAALVIQYKTIVLRTAHLELASGLRITHLSNGAFQLPNLGTNTIITFLSLAQRREHIKPIKATDLKEERLELPTLRVWSLSTAISGGLKEVMPPTGKKYFVAEWSWLIERRQTNKSSWGFGLDVWRNASIPVLLRSENQTVASNAALQAGAVFCYTLHFGKMELKMHQGVYLRNAYTAGGLLYHRFGLRYHINEKWITQLMLNTQFAKAQFGEIGVGYVLWKGGAR